MAQSISNYLASCFLLAVGELQRLLPVDSMLGPTVSSLRTGYPGRWAPGLHAALCLATCRALGGADERVLPSAAVLELYHCVFEPDDGTAFASLAAQGSDAATSTELARCRPNAVLALAFEPLIDECRALGPEQALRVLQIVTRMGREAVEGRAIEASWVRSQTWTLSDADYRGMVLKRTGWHGFIAPMKIGAIIAGANGEQVASLEQFASDLGFAFQLHDDVSELASATANIGGASLAKLRQARHTLPLMHTMRTCSGMERDRLEQALSRIRSGASDSGGPPDARSTDVAFVYDRVRRSGGGEYAQEVGQGYAVRARAALDRARAWVPSSDHGGLLYALADFTMTKVF